MKYNEVPLSSNWLGSLTKTKQKTRARWTDDIEEGGGKRRCRAISCSHRKKRAIDERRVPLMDDNEEGGGAKMSICCGHRCNLPVIDRKPLGGALK